MFDIGFAELTLLAVIGLLVLGPEKLPRVARTVGGYLRKGRQAWNSVRREIESELAAEEIKEEFKKPVDEFDKLRRSARDAAEATTKEVREHGEQVEKMLSDTEPKPGE